MGIYRRRTGFANDDSQLYSLKRDCSGGINDRQDASLIGDKQMSVLTNADIGIPGKVIVRPGSVLIGNDVGSDSILTLYNYTVQGGTDQLLHYEDTALRKWTGSGNWADIKTNFTTSTQCGICQVKESGVSPDDVVIVQNGVDNAFRFLSDGTAQDLGNTAGTGSDSPPKSTVMGWYGNRLWVMLNDLLYFSDAYPADYAVAFDTATNIYRVPVGSERKIIATRDQGLILMGANAIWALNPSATPAATDKPEPILPNNGIVSKNAAVAANDDIYFFGYDGLRGLNRTVMDKLQAGVSYPISYGMKAAFERISWAYISQLSMEYFDNKIFISVPTGAATYEVWVYYPALNGFSLITGWNARSLSKYRASGQEYLYYGKHGDGKVFRAWYGYTDEGTTTSDGTAISFVEEGRKEDLGQPSIRKTGGEIEVSIECTASVALSCYVSLDDGSYNFLGYVTTSSSGITFPALFPLVFSSSTITKKKFHIDGYGEW